MKKLFKSFCMMVLCAAVTLGFGMNSVLADDSFSVGAQEVQEIQPQTIFAGSEDLSVLKFRLTHQGSEEGYVKRIMLKAKASGAMTDHLNNVLVRLKTNDGFQQGSAQYFDDNGTATFSDIIIKSGKEITVFIDTEQVMGGDASKIQVALNIVEGFDGNNESVISTFDPDTFCLDSGHNDFPCGPRHTFIEAQGDLIVNFTRPNTVEVSSTNPEYQEIQQIAFGASGDDLKVTDIYFENFLPDPEGKGQMLEYALFNETGQLYYVKKMDENGIIPFEIAPFDWIQIPKTGKTIRAILKARFQPRYRDPNDPQSLSFKVRTTKSDLGAGDHGINVRADFDGRLLTADHITVNRGFEPNFTIQTQASGETIAQDTIVAGYDDIPMVRFTTTAEGAPGARIDEVVLQAFGEWGMGVNLEGMPVGLSVADQFYYAGTRFDAAGIATFTDVDLPVGTEITVIIDSPEGAHGTQENPSRLQVGLKEVAVVNTDGDRKTLVLDTDCFRTKMNAHPCGPQQTFIESGLLSGTFAQSAAVEIPYNVNKTVQEITFRATHDEIHIADIFLKNHHANDISPLEFEFFNVTANESLGLITSQDGILHLSLRNVDRIRVQEGQEVTIRIKANFKPSITEHNLVNVSLVPVMEEWIKSVTAATGAFLRKEVMTYTLPAGNPNPDPQPDPEQYTIENHQVKGVRGDINFTWNTPEPGASKVTVYQDGVQVATQTLNTDNGGVSQHSMNFDLEACTPYTSTTESKLANRDMTLRAHSSFITNGCGEPEPTPTVPGTENYSITNTRINGVKGDMIFRWTTPEKAASKVTVYSVDDQVVATQTLNTDNSGVMDHEIEIDGLQACAPYRASIESKLEGIDMTLTAQSSFLTNGCISNGARKLLGSKKIAKAGGKFEWKKQEAAPKNQLELEFKKDFHKKEIDFSVAQYENGAEVIADAPAPSGKRPVLNKFFELRALEGVDKEVTAFDEAITVKMAYDEADVAGLDEHGLEIYRHNGASWEPTVDCRVDVINDIITCQTTKFSPFGIFGNEPLNFRSGGGGGVPVNDIVRICDEHMNCRERYPVPTDEFYGIYKSCKQQKLPGYECALRWARSSGLHIEGEGKIERLATEAKPKLRFPKILFR